MRRILLDTHALIWALESPELLSFEANNQISDIGNLVFVSQISFFEIAIKQVIGKISLQHGLIELIEETQNQSIQILQLETKYLETYIRIPILENHRDPFDRLIVATALHEDLEIATVDNKIMQYQPLINIIW